MSADSEAVAVAVAVAVSERSLMRGIFIRLPMVAIRLWSLDHPFESATVAIAVAVAIAIGSQLGVGGWGVFFN
jgi:hypothetical protein